MSFAPVLDPAAPDPRYPIGRFVAPSSITPADRDDAILILAELPEQLREVTRGLDEEQFDTPYREGGWTVRQVVHHIADSHTTALHRVKRTLTEDEPEVHGYREAAFALLEDVKAPAEWSLTILDGTHARWVTLLESLTEEQWARAMRHSERGVQRLDLVTLNYGWHSRHHTAHINHLRMQKGW